jgi:hypothetical protein
VKQHRFNLHLCGTFNGVSIPFSAHSFLNWSIVAGLNELGKRLGIENVRPRRFRCTFAVNGLRRGVSIIQIAAWLGDKPETISAHHLPTSENTLIPAEPVQAKKLHVT